ncbi:MAG TPA: EcsC family protein [Propionibacteriaceae bacterium]|nr:EcsC family protein [Propionibacteriaceae bacterium]
MPSAKDFSRAVIGVAPKVAPGMAAGGLRRLLDFAIDGFQRLPGARAAAATAMGRTGNADSAAESVIRQHVVMAGAQGFVTNLGGLPALPVAIPANVSGVAIIQSRMVAAIAHLRGYDIDDSRVRTAILMCMLGQNHAEDLIAKKELPFSPLVIATAPVYDPALNAQIAERVVTNLMGHVGGKRIGVMASKKISVIGGGVGLATDAWSTYSVARYAQAEFVDRRVRGTAEPQA